MIVDSAYRLGKEIEDLTKDLQYDEQLSREDRLEIRDELTRLKERYVRLTGREYDAQ